MTALLALVDGADWLPSASSFAPRVDGLFKGLLMASVGVVGSLSVITAVILIRYRRGSAVKRPPVRTATWKIETAWTVATTAVFLYFFVKGAALYLDMRRDPVDAEDVSVVGRQWMWDVRYADGRREFNELHVRLNQPVRLILSSEDVIHSFFVPAFRLKQDLVPGKIVIAWFNPTRVGTYRLFCAQYCGTAHAQMMGQVVVLAPDQYAAWQGGRGDPAGTRPPGPTSVARGRAVYARYGCAECHDAPSGTRAPPLAGVYQGLIRLGDGRFVRADEQYLHDAILHAPQNAAAGYALAMPSYQGLIAETDVVDLVSYIRSLGVAGPTALVP
jgi:cytochrome c oxidase subunit II